MAECRSWRLLGRCRVTDPRLAWFAIGATCSAVLFGWPWHPWFSRFSRNVRSISYPDPGPDRQPTNPFTGDPVKPQPHGGRIIPGDTL